MRGAVLGGIAAAALVALASDIPINCAEYYRHANGHLQAQRFVNGKCFYYYANRFKQELWIYEPKPEQQNIGTLTEIISSDQTDQIDVSRHAVMDLRKGPNPDDTMYEFIHKVPISHEEKMVLTHMLQEFVRRFKLNQKYET